MNDSQQARALVRETFPQTFDKGRFHHFVKELLNGFDETKAAPMAVPDAFAPHVRSCSRLGTYESPDGELADVLIVNTTEPWKLERTRTALRDFVAHKLKRGDSYKEAGLVAFVAPDARSWRFSFVRMEYESKRDPKTGKIAVEERLTPARRFSYIVGENESCHTAQNRFLDLLQDTENKPPLAKIEEAFSVEIVTDEFFKQYKLLFLDLKDELDSLARKDKIIAEEFAAKKVSTADFAKKLMGQIVFLYFLQKKGWLGVPKGGEWRDGPHNFLRQLFNGKYGGYKNFFNDILEPLFYDTLATDRGREAMCKIFNCRIPFLNGGLFEPLRDYDWQKTDIIIPNRVFANSDFVEQGVTGTGILDVFDRYNFTVNEAEPLEKEVAIDPEMLGKVFENLLEVKERKSKGSFYTPREIVHYMCQESLINYLDTAVNSSAEIIGREKRKQASFGDEKAEQTLLTAPAYRELVPRADIEMFIHSGDQASHYEAARVEGTDYRRNLPKGIETHARLLDDKLADIAVCDLAIGSGAFPVGMMQEIVRARSALTPYLEDEIKKDKQLTQSKKDKRLAELKEKTTAYALKKHAIQNCLYGVDIDPGAVEIAKLRLWLSLVVDEDDVKQIKPLPNLDYKIVVGNSLLGVEKNLFNQEHFKRLEELKPKYFDATDRKQKEKIKHEIDNLIHELTNGKEAFDFEIYFSEVFHRKKGFDVLIGNPPYGMVTDEKAKSYFETNYISAEGRFDTFELFLERAVTLGRAIGGKTMFIIPSPVLTNVYSRKLRRFFLQETSLTEITNFGIDVFADPTVHTCILGSSRPFTKNNLIAIRKQVADVSELKNDFDYKIPQSEIAQGEHSSFDIFLAPDIRGLVKKIRKASSQLSDICHIRQCIKTGDDDKYVKNSEKQPSSEWKPSLRGRSIDRYCIHEKNLWINYGSWLARNWQNESFYEVEKIAVRETGARIIATLDTEHRYFLSSLYSVYPISHTNAYSLKFLLAIINSNFATWFVRLIAFGLTHGAFTKIRTNQFGRLPIPAVTSEQQQPVERLVERILAAKQRDVGLRSDPPASNFGAAGASSPQAGADVSALERELDELVYALYALTPEEIKIVEGTATEH